MLRRRRGLEGGKASKPISAIVAGSFISTEIAPPLVSGCRLRPPPYVVAITGSDPLPREPSS